MFWLKLCISFMMSLSISEISSTAIAENKVGTPNYYRPMGIIIPKLNLEEPFILGDNEMTKMDKIQLAPYSNLPSDTNAHLIFMAHSGNSNTSYFKGLEKLVNNDSIYIVFQKHIYHYVVYKKVIINPNTIEALYYKANHIILLTCYRHHYRLLVYGKLKTVN